MEAQSVGVSANPKSASINFVVENKINFHYEPWSKLIDCIVYKK